MSKNKKFSNPIASFDDESGGGGGAGLQSFDSVDSTGSKGKPHHPLARIRAGPAELAFFLVYF